MEYFQLRNKKVIKTTHHLHLHGMIQNLNHLTLQVITTNNKCHHLQQLAIIIEIIERLTMLKMLNNNRVKIIIKMDKELFRIQCNNTQM